MGPEYTDEEVLLAVRDRPDLGQILTRLAYFSDRLAEKGRAVNALQEELMRIGEDTPKVVALARRASGLSEDISRLTSERDQYVLDLMGIPPKIESNVSCPI